MTSFSGKTVLITGAASGIGRLMALEAVRRGATLVAWDIYQGPLDILLGEVLGTGGKAYVHICDVGDRDAVQRTADLVQQEVGPVDILVNNAGVVRGRRFLDLTPEDIESTLRVNTLAHFWTTQAFLPAMIERNSGHLVTIASAVAFMGVPRLSAYTASKHAAEGLAESVRLELAQTAPGVRTTVVCPLLIDTGMFEGAKVRFPRLSAVLRPEAVATAVVAAVENERVRVYLPPIVYLGLALRIAPVRISDALLGFLGVTTAMDDFVGREADR